jgi:signal peptidase
MMKKSKDSSLSSIQRWISILVTVMLVLAVALCLYVAIQLVSNGYTSVGGYSMFRVVTGSMEPTIPTGALLIAQETSVEEIETGDIICFRTKEAEIAGKIVTHRVVERLKTAEGSVLFRTQGDANLAVDSYFVEQDHLIGKVIWHTGDDSKMASIFSFFSNGLGFLGCIVLPCLLLAGLILRECMSNIRREMENALQELEEAPEQTDPLCGMTPEEYKQMYERISAELIEELMAGAKKAKTE